MISGDKSRPRSAHRSLARVEGLYFAEDALERAFQGDEWIGRDPVAGGDWWELSGRHLV